MAVIKNTIKTELKALYLQAQSGMTDDEFADAMANIIRNAILSATVNTGIAVTVSVSTGIGSTTGTGTLS